MEKNFPAFITSLIGGIFMLLSGISVLTGILYVYTSAPDHFISTVPSETMMGGMMGYWFYGLPLIGAMVSLASGIIVIIGSLKLYKSSEESTTWGTLIIIFSVVSLLGTGGFIVGFILGLVGGILALTMKPS